MLSTSSARGWWLWDRLWIIACDAAAHRHRATKLRGRPTDYESVCFQTGVAVNVCWPFKVDSVSTLSIRGHVWQTLLISVFNLSVFTAMSATIDTLWKLCLVFQDWYLCKGLSWKHALDKHELVLWSEELAKWVEDGTQIQTQRFLFANTRIPVAQGQSHVAGSCSLQDHWVRIAVAETVVVTQYQIVAEESMATQTLFMTRDAMHSGVKVSDPAVVSVHMRCILSPIRGMRSWCQAQEHEIFSAVSSASNWLHTKSLAVSALQWTTGDCKHTVKWFSRTDMPTTWCQHTQEKVRQMPLINQTKRLEGWTQTAGTGGSD